MQCITHPRRTDVYALTRELKGAQPLPGPTGPRTKSRAIETPSTKHRAWGYNAFGMLNDQTGAYKTRPGSQVTVSEGHPWKSRKRGSLNDIGGEFSTQKSYWISDGSPVSMKRTEFGITDNYTGPLFPLEPGDSRIAYPPGFRSTRAQLNAAGATAIARCAPTNPAADAATFLGELFREGVKAPLEVLRSLQNRTDIARSAGKDYLNVQFGWRPLVHDVRSIMSAIDHADAVLAQFERDSGNVVRRRYRFPTVVSRSDRVVTPFTAPAGPASPFIPSGHGGAVTEREEITSNRWFSGAFTYYVNRGDTARDMMQAGAQRAKKVLGLSLTPDTLWNLAPWSWAVDWFTNTGDVLSNLTAAAVDGQVLHYGYIMEHTIALRTYSYGGPAYKTGHIVPPMHLVTETKVRQRANPFGFGLTWEGLSPFQLSILAALGISRR